MMSQEAMEGALIFMGIVALFVLWLVVHLSRYRNKKCSTCKGSGRLASASFADRWRTCPACGGLGDFIRDRAR